ncbi:protein HGV2 [Phalaenopsis equestris]|uniref:protein HGV2 n=1 Tax=Phalaenopsis equestris TaxID=78828 RepID=UPI0009E3514F|nr:protein HGV2 [Phalaenopsis equestris]
MAFSDDPHSASAEIAADDPSAEASPILKDDKTLVSAPGAGKSIGIQSNGGSANVDACSTEDEEGDEEDGLEHATELFEKGSKAIEAGDFTEAVDCLSRALEIRVANYGDLSPECASSYYKYGCALLYKAQEETDPLGDVPKNTQRNSTKDESAANMEECGGSVPSSELKEQNSSNKSEIGGVSDLKSTEDENEEVEGDDEELGEADEDDSDLDLAWKMLDIARAIFEKNPENSIEKVNVFSALGEVSMEREDVETSLTDYTKALAILEDLVEPDNRRVIELNFRICMVLELGSKVEEAIPYCEKAISLCKSRIERLKEVLMKSKDTAEASKNSVSELDESGKELSSESLNLDGEIDQLRGISTELEKKLEDLQQLMSNPKSILIELLKRNDSTLTSGEKSAIRDFSRSSSVSSSQMAAIEGGSFDSPTISTAANGGFTDLGVVGRGIKRAIVTPTGTEPTLKKSPSELSVEKADSCVSEVRSNAQASEASSK